MCHDAPAGGKRRVIMGGRAFFHINGVEYESPGQYPTEDGDAFRDLQLRIEGLFEQTTTQRFGVLINGHFGRLLVRPSELVSAAVVYVPKA
jgi:hypothetical protein